MNNSINLHENHLFKTQFKSIITNDKEIYNTIDEIELNKVTYDDLITEILINDFDARKVDENSS
jgi:hypothetical protein